MKKALNTTITVLAILLAFPVSLILVSWNALPGDTAYPTKKWLETMALKMVEGLPLERKLEVEYIKRRSFEADQLLIQKGSALGYTYLSAQAYSAKEKIVETQDQRAKEDLVTILTELNQKLEKRKTAFKKIVETQEVIKEIIEELEEKVRKTPKTQILFHHLLGHSSIW